MIVGHGDYEAGKPAPDPFLKAASRLGVAPRLCLALDDSHNGVRSATAAGMMTVMVPDLLEPTDELVRLCAFVACDLHEVHSAVLTAWGKAPKPNIRQLRPNVAPGATGSKAPKAALHEIRDQTAGFEPLWTLGPASTAVR